MVYIPVIDDEEATRLHVHGAVAVVPSDHKRAVAHAKAIEMARNAPDVDVAKVHQLKAQLQNGTYRVDADSIAEAMLKEAVQDVGLGCDFDSPSIEDVTHTGWMNATSFDISSSSQRKGAMRS